MSENISTIIKYILTYYPHKDELSASRLTKILYLVDWKNSIENGEQLTNSIWYYNHYGPYVEDFMKIAEEDSDIEIKNESNVFGGKKRLLKMKNSCKVKITLKQEEKQLVDFVINATKEKSYADFINLVYSTYPVLISDKYTQIDLVTLACEYKKLKLKSTKVKPI